MESIGLQDMIGKKIVSIRPISKAELEEEGWDGHGATSVIELEDGTIIYPSSDDEGNNAGTLFGKDKNGQTFYVFTKEEIK